MVESLSYRKSFSFRVKQKANIKQLKIQILHNHIVKQELKVDMIASSNTETFSTFMFPISKSSLSIWGVWWPTHTLAFAHFIVHLILQNYSDHALWQLNCMLWYKIFPIRLVYNWLGHTPAKIFIEAWSKLYQGIFRKIFLSTVFHMHSMYTWTSFTYNWNDDNISQITEPKLLQSSQHSTYDKIVYKGNSNFKYIQFFGVKNPVPNLLNFLSTKIPL